VAEQCPRLRERQRVVVRVAVLLRRQGRRPRRLPLQPFLVQELEHRVDQVKGRVVLGRRGGHERRDGVGVVGQVVVMVVMVMAMVGVHSTVVVPLTVPGQPAATTASDSAVGKPVFLVRLILVVVVVVVVVVMGVGVTAASAAATAAAAAAAGAAGAVSPHRVVVRVIFQRQSPPVARPRRRMVLHLDPLGVPVQHDAVLDLWGWGEHAVVADAADAPVPGHDTVVVVAVRPLLRRS